MEKNKGVTQGLRKKYADGWKRKESEENAEEETMRRRSSGLSPGVPTSFQVACRSKLPVFVSADRAIKFVHHG